MLEKKMDTLKTGLFGLLVWSIGIIVVVYRDIILTLGIPFNGMILILMAILSLWNHQDRKTVWTTFILGIIHLMVPNLPVLALLLSFIVVFMLHAFAHGVTAVLHFRNDYYLWLKEALLAIFYSIFSLILALNPLDYVQGILFLIGIYLCLYGLSDIREALIEHFKVHLKSKRRRKVRIQLPAILALLIPTQVLKAINEYCEDKEGSVVSDVKVSGATDIEVLIHMTPSGYSAMGHVDISYQGYVITYGNYDASSYRMMDAIGEGVLMVVKKEDYIPFCKADTGKTLIGFGLSLSDEQKRAVHRQIRKIFSNLVEWECVYKQAESENNEERMKTSLKYYANRIYKATKARMYKFKRGKYKTYFVLTTNCVVLADSILGKAGVDLIGSNGVITPGTYYDYLNRQFTKRQSQVVSRTVYH